jgi:rhamnogalacturonan endolyase
VTAGSATITLNGGTLYLGSGGIVKNGAAGLATTLSFSSGTLGAKANWATALPVTLPSGGNVTFKAADAANNPFNIGFNGVISGAGGFTKTGGGTLTLDGAVTHTYTGTTTVNAGALRVTATLGTATNGVAINNGGALTGNGVVNRPITLNTGGVVAPDGATAIATLSGASLTWNGGGKFAVDLGASGSSDALALSGALTKGTAGTFAIALAPGAGFAAGNTYTLATFGSTSFAAGDFTFTGLPAGYAAACTVTATSLQLTIVGTPVITSATSAGGMFGVPFLYTITATNVPTSFSAAGLPAGLALDPATGMISGSPVAGTFTVTLGATNLAGTGSATLILTIAKAPAMVTLGNLAATYDGLPHAASVATVPAGLAVGVTYNGSPTAPTNAGSYAVVATVNDANYFGGAADTLVIAKASQTITFPNPGAKTYGDPPFALTATASSGLPVSYAVVSGPATVSGSTVTLTSAGSVTLRAEQGGNANYLAAPSVDVTLNVAKGAATVTLTNLTQAYDGTPKTPTVTTNPAGLTVDVTYNGSPTAPTLPGSYAVVATIDDPSYTGSANATFVITITALINHAPVLNGDIDGSAQMLLPENVTLNSAMVSGDLLVPGTPTVRLNGHPTYGGTVDGSGNASPVNYTVTLNGNATLRHVIRRTDPIAMPTVAAPPTPTGNRVVTLNNANQSVGDFTTLRDLTLNGNVGAIAVPPGTYGAFTANGGNSFILGVAGATEPAVYNLQSLVLNGSAQLQIVGPVTLTLAGGLNVNNGTVGASAHPEWLVLQIASGGLTLNGNSTLHGGVTAPNGTVIINGSSTLHGTVTADRLTINGNGVLTEVFP